MAFNPLRQLRKHSKVFMAGLVLICMVTFVLSSGVMGAGDFFGWLQNILGGRGAYSEIGSVYGQRIDQQEFQRLLNQRRLAHEYMTQAVMAASAFARQKSDALAKDAKKGGDQTTMAEQRKANETADLLRDRIMQLQMTGQLYFGGSLSPQDLFDFLIWKKQADRLGIHLTEADVSRERNVELGGELPGTYLAEVERKLSGRGNPVSKETLVAALTDEFRVRLAKAALLGPDAPPPPPRQQFQQFDLTPPTRTQTSYTPHEYWEYFRKNRTEISVTVLPIPVRDLLPLVKTIPTQDELKELYDKYRDREPHPADATPGFKQPRRIQVDWVSGSAKDAPYPRVAEVTLAVAEATLPTAFDYQMMDQYRKNRFRFRLSSWTEEQSGKALLPGFKLLEFETASRMRGLPLASAQGALVAAVLGSYQASVAAQDLKDSSKWAEEETKIRKQFLASALTFSLLPGGSLLATSAAPLGVVARIHAGDQWGEYPPFHVVKRHLVKGLRDNAADELLRKNQETFRKELEKLRARPEEAKKYVAEATQKFGFKSGGMKQPRDRYTIFEDPSMEALRESLKSSIKFFAGMQGTRDFERILDDDPSSRILSGQLFPDIDGTMWQWSVPPSAQQFLLSVRQIHELSKLYTPRHTFHGEPTYIYWTTVDKAAYVPPFDEVKDQVAEVWRLRKAREEAKKEAEKVAERVKKAGRDAQREMIEGSPYSGKLFDLYQVTRLKPPEQAVLPGRDRQYTRYQIPKSDIEFPTPDFVEKVLELNDIGDVVVLHDQPETTWYVVTPRSRREEPGLDSFRALYRRSSPAEFFPDPMLGQFDRARREEQRKAVLEQLRADAKQKLNKEGIKGLEEERQ